MLKPYCVPCSMVDLVLEMALQVNLFDLKPQGGATFQPNSTLAITGTSVHDLQMVMKMLIMTIANIDNNDNSF